MFVIQRYKFGKLALFPSTNNGFLFPNDNTIKPLKHSFVFSNLIPK